MENKGNVASIFQPNIEKAESSGDLGKIIGGITPPDFSNLNIPKIDQIKVEGIERPEIPEFTLPDFKTLIPTFKF